MDVLNAAKTTAQNITKLQIIQGKHPQTIAGVAIFIVSQLSTDKRSCADIAKEVNMTEPTIRQAYKSVYDYRQQVLPHWWSHKEKLENLSKP